MSELRQEAPLSATSKLTRGQVQFLLKARNGAAPVSNKKPSPMQVKLEAAGLITRDHYGQFVLSDAGATALRGY